MYVEMKDICKNYGDFRASDHVSFGIEKGKLVALLGPSGSGKTDSVSTMFRQPKEALALYFRITHCSVT